MRVDTIMSNDPFDDLPDQMREAIREMMKKFQEIDPQQLQHMMEQLFGKDFMEKMKDMSAGGGFGFPMDPEMMRKFQGMMNNPANKSPPHSEEPEITMEEPYYEIIPQGDEEGQILVDLPGIQDVRQVKWERTEFGLELTAESDEAKYAIDIPLNKKFKLRDMFASLTNATFTLPYRRED